MIDVQTEIQAIDAAAKSLKKLLPSIPDRVIVLGSGLGAFADRLEGATAIPYGDIEGFPKPTVEGHRGELIHGVLGDTDVLAMAGRFHYYEGHPLAIVVRPVRVFAKLGVDKLMITNAAGGVNKKFSPGDLMLITDHLNMTGMNPLMGDNLDAFGSRFPDMTYAYDRDYLAVARRVADEKGLTLREGVYTWMTGPTYETPAEIRMLRTMGADATGMSTVPEVIAATHAGMRVVGVSLITNMAAGVLDQPLNHQEVIDTAAAAAKRFEELAEGILRAL